MEVKREKAAVIAGTTATAKQSCIQKSDYQTHPQPSTEKRITERLESMPRSYRKTYKTAIKGKSRKAAIKAFCLECCCWQKEEVKLCTSKVCPLYPYRPYQDFSQSSDNRHFTEPQDVKDKQGVSNIGSRYKNDHRRKTRA